MKKETGKGDKNNINWRDKEKERRLKEKGNVFKEQFGAKKKKSLNFSIDLKCSAFFSSVLEVRYKNLLEDHWKSFLSIQYPDIFKYLLQNLLQENNLFFYNSSSKSNKTLIFLFSRKTIVNMLNFSSKKKFISVVVSSVGI